MKFIEIGVAVSATITLLTCNLLFLSSFLVVSDQLLSKTEKQRHDGWFNNLAHPDWGSVGKFQLFKQFLLHYLTKTIL